MTFIGVTNAHGPSPQPTACRSPTCSLMIATGSNQAQGNLLCPRSLGWMGEQSGANMSWSVISPVTPPPHGDLVKLLSPPTTALVGSALWRWFFRSESADKRFYKTRKKDVELLILGFSHFKRIYAFLKIEIWFRLESLRIKSSR